MLLGQLGQNPNMQNEVRIALAAKVPLRECERLMGLLQEAGAVDLTFSPSIEGGYLLVPILDPEKLQANAELRSLELVKRGLRVHVRKPRDIREALLTELEPDVVGRIRRSFDIIGDVAIVSPEENTSRYRRFLVDAMLSVHPNIRLILAKVSPVSGRERVASYKRWYGSGSTETTHKEHGCVYTLDVTKVFFTPRLSTERKRVASLVRPNETVSDLFAGVGPFSVLAAKLQPASNVKACDISPEAFAYLRRNIRLNGVSDRVEAFLGDAAEVSHTHLKGISDRVIMNLPKKAELYLDAATASLKPSGGIIHLYLFRREPQTFEGKMAGIEAELRSLGWGSVEVQSHGQVREIGPREFNDVADIKVS